MKQFTIEISMRTCWNGFLNFCSSGRQWCKKQIYLCKVYKTFTASFDSFMISYFFLFGLELVFLLFRETYHNSLSSLLPAIKHLERALQATFIIDDSQIVQAAVYFLLPLEHFHSDAAPSISDKIPNRVIPDTQWSITRVKRMNQFEGGP